MTPCLAVGPVLGCPDQSFWLARLPDGGPPKYPGNKIHILTGCCRRRQGLNRSGCNTWGGTRTGLGGGSWSWYVLRCRSLALGCGCRGCWGGADTGRRLGAGLLTNLRAHPGNVRRAHLRANQRALPPPFVMSLTALMARPLRGHRVLCRARGHTILCRGGCLKCGGLAGWSPEWDFPLTISGKERATMSKSTSGPWRTQPNW